MKKIYLSILSIVGFLGMNAQQIPNGSFESWTGGMINEPVGWFTLNFATATYPTYGAIQSSDAYDGQSSLQLRSNQFDLNPFGWPILDTSAYAATGTPDSSGPNYGFPFAFRPEKMTFYYKYTPGSAQGNDVDTAHVYVRFTLAGNNIGEGEMKIYGGAVSTWTYAEVLITWFAASNPDTAMIDAASSMTNIAMGTDQTSTNLIGNELKLDKMMFTYPVGIQENISTEMKIYPNPATDILTVQNVPAAADYEICDALGNIVKRGKVGSGAIDISHLSGGVYFIQVLNGGEKSASRFSVF